MEYVVEIRETLVRQERVVAECQREAVDKIQRLYDSQQIVLDYDDFCNLEIVEIEGGEEEGS